MTMTSCIPRKRPHVIVIFAKYANKQNQSQVLYQKSCCKNVSLKIRPHATGEWFSDDNSNDGDDVDAERDEFGQTLISLPQLATAGHKSV